MIICTSSNIYIIVIFEIFWNKYFFLISIDSHFFLFFVFFSNVWSASCSMNFMFDSLLFRSHLPYNVFGCHRCWQWRHMGVAGRIRLGFWKLVYRWTQWRNCRKLSGDRSKFARDILEWRSLWCCPWWKSIRLHLRERYFHHF